MAYTKEEFKKEWEKEDCQITFEDCADCLRDWSGIRQVMTWEPWKATYRCLIECGMEKEAEEYAKGWE